MGAFFIYFKFMQVFNVYTFIYNILYLLDKKYNMHRGLIILDDYGYC